MQPLQADPLFVNVTSLLPLGGGAAAVAGHGNLGGTTKAANYTLVLAHSLDACKWFGERDSIMI